MRKQKVVLIFLITILMVSVFAGCTGKKGEIIMGTNAEFEPFEYRESGKIVGFDVDIATEIAKDLGKELVIEDMAFNSLISALASGKCNFIAAGMSIDEDRKVNVDFSDPYFNASQMIIVKTGNNTIKTEADLKGKKVGVQEGTTGDDLVSDIKDVAEVCKFKGGPDAVLDLINNKIDAVVIDNAPAKALVKLNSDKIKLIEKPLSVEEYAIAVKKGNKELLDSINKTLKRLKDSGKYDELYKTYFDEE